MINSQWPAHFVSPLDRQSNFASAVASIGDVNGDGVPDLAVGSERDSDGGTSNTGAIYILFLDEDGTLDDTTPWSKISDSHGGFDITFTSGLRLGSAIAGIGDLNSDGVPDLAAGVATDADGGTARGAVYILFLDSDGTLDNVTPYQKISDTAGQFGATLDDSDYFGSSVANIGDLNNDGTTDIIVGATDDDDGGSNRGAAYVLFLDSDGTVSTDGVCGCGYQKISATTGGMTALDASDQFGYAVAGIGDLDDDGNEDVAVSAVGDDDGAGQNGAVYILFLDSDGTVILPSKISDTVGDFAASFTAGAGFGEAITSLGDINGDGVTDIAVGAASQLASTGFYGVAYILFMEEDGTVDDVAGYSLIQDLAGHTSERLGESLAAIPDLDDNDIPELFIGHTSNSDGTIGEGGGFIAFLEGTGLPPDTTPPTPGSSGTLTETGDTETTLSFSWSEATDETSAQGTLVYKVYYAASGVDLSTVNLAETNGTLAQTTADISSATVSGLTGETTYAFQIVVSDEAGNKSAYTQLSGTTGTIPDVTPPTPGSGGGMVKLSSTTSSLSIRLATSSDDETAQGSLIYKLYRAADETDLSTVELVEAGGTLVDTLVGEVDFEATGLASNTTYTFNAIVEDASGNKALYDQTDFTTDNPLTQRPTYPTRTSVLINGGAECTSSRDVIITVEGTNVDRIVFANNQRFLGSLWELFSGSPMQKTWTLLDQEGEQSVYVVFRSWHGNKSYIHEQTIAYEPTNPDCGAIAVNTETEEGAEETTTETTTETPTTETPTETETTTETPTTETPTETETTTETPTTETPAIEVPLTPTIEEEVVEEVTLPAENTVSPEVLEGYLSTVTLMKVTGVIGQYAIKTADGRNYLFADRTAILSWAAHGSLRVTSLKRKDWNAMVFEPQTIGPLPGTAIVNFNNTYYWLEDGGSPTSVTARPFASRAVVEEVFGRSWKKYLINIDAKTAALYTEGSMINSTADLSINPESLKDVRTIKATPLP